MLSLTYTDGNGHLTGTPGEMNTDLEIARRTWGPNMLSTVDSHGGPSMLAMFTVMAGLIC